MKSVCIFSTKSLAAQDTYNIIEYTGSKSHALSHLKKTIDDPIIYYYAHNKCKLSLQTLHQIIKKYHVHDKKHPYCYQIDIFDLIDYVDEAIQNEEPHSVSDSDTVEFNNSSDSDSSSDYERYIDTESDYSSDSGIDSNYDSNSDSDSESDYHSYHESDYDTDSDTDTDTDSFLDSDYSDYDTDSDSDYYPDSDSTDESSDDSDDYNVCNCDYCSKSEFDHNTDDESSDDNDEDSPCMGCIEKYLDSKDLMIVPKSSYNSHTNITDNTKVNNIDNTKVANNCVDKTVDKSVVRHIKMGNSEVNAPQIINTGNNNQFVIKQYFIAQPSAKKSKSTKSKSIPISAPVSSPKSESKAPVTSIGLDLKKEIAFDILEKLCDSVITEDQYNYIIGIIENATNADLISIITKVLINTFCTGEKINSSVITDKILKEKEISEYLSKQE